MTGCAGTAVWDVGLRQCRCAPPWVPDRVRQVGGGSWRCGRYDVGVGVSPSRLGEGARLGSGSGPVSRLLGMTVEGARENRLWVVGGVAGTTLGVSAFLPHPNPLPLGEGARVGSGSGPASRGRVVGVKGTCGSTGESVVSSSANGSVWPVRRWVCRRFSLTPTLSRWERGQEWVPDRVRRIGCGSWRCGRYDVGCVGVSPSPQPSPAGRGGKSG